MANKVFNIIIRLVKEGGGDKDTISALVGIKSAMTQGMAIAGAMVGAYYAVDKVLDATVGKFASYAKGVDVFSSALSTTSQEASRLIQVADDFGISSDEMQAAMFRAVKGGMDPTVAGLAGMADKYNALATPQEKADFLTKNFGKSSQELTRLLGEGKQAILDRSDAVANSLVLDADAILKAREYEAAQNDLNDAWTAAKVAIGRDMLPPLTQLIKRYVEGLDAQQLYSHAQELGINIGRNFWTGQEEVNGVLITQAELLMLVKNAMNDGVDQGAALQAVWESDRVAAGALVGSLGDLTAALITQQADWETSYTSAKDSTDKSSMAMDLLGESIRGLGAEGAMVWNGFLEATGKISPAAAFEFARVMTIVGNVQNMLASGASLGEIVVYLKFEGGVAASMGTDDYYQRQKTPTSSAGGGWTYKGTNNGPGTGGFWTNAQGGVHHGPPGPDDHSFALGGLFSDGAARVGEKGEEWLVRNSGGQVVVVPNNIVRQLQAWGINPGEGFGGGGDLVLDGQIIHRTGGFTPSKPASQPIASSGSMIYRPGATYGPASGGGSSGVSGASAAAAVSAVAAVEAVSPVVTQAMQVFQAAQQVSTQANTIQVAQQTRAVQQSGEAQKALLRSILSAIEGQPEQLAAEIQKRR